MKQSTWTDWATAPTGLDWGVPIGDSAPAVGRCVGLSERKWQTDGLILSAGIHTPATPSVSDGPLVGPRPGPWLWGATPATVNQDHWPQRLGPLAWNLSQVAYRILGFLLTSLLLEGARAEVSPNGNTNQTQQLVQLSFDELLQVKVDTVYGVSKFEQRIAAAPASVSIVTQEEIKMFGYRTLADALRSVNGLYVSYDRNYSYLGIRGLNRPGDYTSRILVLVDGHRMNENIYDSAAYGTDFPVDIDMIDRIEVIRGPASSVYGNNAVMGVINVVTKTGRQFSGAELSSEVASWDTYKGRFSYGHAFTNEVEMLLSGSYYDSGGQRSLYFREYDAAATGHGIAHRRDQDRYGDFLGSLRWKDFTLEALLAERIKQVPTASYETLFDDGREETTDLRGAVALEFDHAFDERTQLSCGLAYDRYEYRGTYPLPADPLAPETGVILNKDRTIGEWATLDTQLRHNWGERLSFAEGLELRQNITQYQQNYDDSPRVDYFSDNRHIRNLGLYVQGDANLLTHLTLTTGVRYDYQDNYGSEVNPRAGLIVGPWSGCTVKLLYGQAFRAPNTYELYYQDSGGVQKANPGLRPETLRSYEVSIAQQLPAHVQVDLSGYHYQMDNLIEQAIDPADGILVFQNLSRARAYGLEAGGEWRHDLGIRARLSYAWQQAKDAATDHELSNSPRNLAKINLILPAYKDKVFVGLELQYSSGVHPFGSAADLTDDFWVANLTLFSQKLLKGVEFSASLYNLTDEKYASPAGPQHRMQLIEQDGRSFRCKLTYRF